MRSGQQGRLHRGERGATTRGTSVSTVAAWAAGMAEGCCCWVAWAQIARRQLPAGSSSLEGHRVFLEAHDTHRTVR